MMKRLISFLCTLVILSAGAVFAQNGGMNHSGIYGTTINGAKSAGVYDELAVGGHPLFANNGPAFFNPLTSSLNPDKASPGTTATFTRATTATVLGYGPTANFGDAQILLTVASGEARFQGARRISQGVWSDKYADGTAISTSTLLGYLAEGARTNHFLQSGTPATQTSTSLATGTYTLSITGTGSIAVAGNTATITGAGSAVAGTPVTFVVTVAGTVNYTVTGTPTTAQAELGAFPSSYIPTTTVAVTRNADVLTYPVAGNFNDTAGTIFAEFKWPLGTGSSPRIIGDGNTTGLNTPLYGPLSVGNIQVGSYDGATTVVSNAVATNNALHKGATTWSSSGRSVFIDGANKVSGTYAGSFGLTSIGIGVGGNSPWFGTIRNIKVYPRVLSDTEIAAQ